MSDVPPDTTVLVVDDEESIHKLFAQLLKQAGYVVLHARTVSEAKSQIRGTRIDAAILDLTLRDAESGLDILSWLRSRREHARMPVLILTGHTVLSEDDEETIRRERAYVFYKGPQMTEIVEHLRDILLKSRRSD
jgi:DNA-binding response OmpR family regulator